MKNENFAERLFCDLRNAEIKLEKPYYVQGGSRITGNNIQFNIIGIRDKYSFTCGVEANLDCQSTFTEAYQKLLDEILKLGNARFLALQCPQKGPEIATLEEYEKVVTRYVRDYLHMSDDVIERWDVLIEKVNSNVS